VLDFLPQGVKLFQGVVVVALPNQRCVSLQIGRSASGAEANRPNGGQKIVRIGSVLELGAAHSPDERLRFDSQAFYTDTFTGKECRTGSREGIKHGCRTLLGCSRDNRFGPCGGKAGAKTNPSMNR
jgi:hypothetical protein